MSHNRQKTNIKASYYTITEVCEEPNRGRTVSYIALPRMSHNRQKTNIQASCYTIMEEPNCGHGNGSASLDHLQNLDKMRLTSSLKTCQQAWCAWSGFYRFELVITFKASPKGLTWRWSSCLVKPMLPGGRTWFNFRIVKRPTMWPHRKTVGVDHSITDLPSGLVGVFRGSPIFQYG